MTTIYRRSLLAATALGLAIGLLAPGATPAVAQEKVTLRLGHDQVTGHTYQRTTLQFAKRIAEETNNEVTIRVMPGAQLGTETGMLDGLKSGNINLSVSTTANASSFIKKYGILSVSYLFTDEKHFARVLNDPQFLKMFDDMTAEAKPGFRRAGLITPGARHYYSNKGPVASIDDLKQIKMRVMASPVESKVWSALGTSPLAIPFGELYTGMQTGLVQAAENSPGSYGLNKHYEVASYFSLTGHQWPISGIFISDITWNKLSDKHKAAFTKVAGEISAFAVKDAVESDAQVLADMQTKNGVKVNKVDTAPFVAKLSALQDEVAKDLGTTEMLARIRALK
ncbi:MAG: TRAP transporter substrate-binding protein [Rhodospirillales bacterium]|nr:TRAP transporter substrate-binding protein [Rhodospirillales bacterium]